MLPLLLLPALAAPPVLPALFPKEIPLPPGAKLVQVHDQSRARAGSQSMVVSLQGGKGVLDFYRALFKERGWPVQDLAPHAPVLSAKAQGFEVSITLMEGLGTAMVAIHPSGGSFAAHAAPVEQGPPTLRLDLKPLDTTSWRLSGATFPGDDLPGALLVRREDGSLWGLGGGLVHPRPETDAHGKRYCRQEDIPMAPTWLAEGVRFAVAAPGAPFGAIFYIDEAGTLHSQGADSGGRLGTGIADATFRYFEAAPVLRQVRFVAAGPANTAAITTSGALYVWGSNLSKQIPGSTRDFEKAPVKVMEDVIHVALAREAVYAVKADGTLWGWGEAYENGFLDGGVVRRRETPYRIFEGVQAVFTADIGPILALKADGSLWSWGANSQGQCGQGTRGITAKPARIAEGVAKVAMDHHHAALLKRDGTVWTWGMNWGTRCGFPQAEPTILRPRKLAEGAADIAVTSGETFVLQPDGSLWGAGRNSGGRMLLRDGARQTELVEVRW